MAIVTLQLNIEQAHEVDVDGEVYGITSYFVRGGHYTIAFWPAMRRYMDEMDARSFACTQEDFERHVSYQWWRDEPVYDEETGKSTGVWYYRQASPETTGAYPVTIIDRATVDALLEDEPPQDEVG
jgi:hypothetical protein